jgi:hypothetical protein
MADSASTTPKSNSPFGDPYRSKVIPPITIKIPMPPGAALPAASNVNSDRVR